LKVALHHKLLFFRHNAEMKIKTTNSNPHLTDADWALLNLLQANARAPVAELALALGLARTTVQARLKRLEVSGVIAGYTVQLGTRERSARVQAHVLLEVDAKRTQATIRALKDLPQVRAVQSVSGPFDYVAQLEEQSVERLDAVLDRIGALDGVLRTQSLVVLATKFERHAAA
jgi:DNA-binding Lrp family transcriptional regulator